MDVSLASSLNFLMMYLWRRNVYVYICVCVRVCVCVCACVCVCVVGGDAKGMEEHGPSIK